MMDEVLVKYDRNASGSNWDYRHPPLHCECGKEIKQFDYMIIRKLDEDGQHKIYCLTCGTKIQNERWKALEILSSSSTVKREGKQ